MKSIHKSLFHFVFTILIIWLSTQFVTAQDNLVFFGTHSVGTQKGISVAHFNSKTGILTKPELVAEAPAPAYFIIHPDGKSLYVCNSNDFAKGYTGQTISSYSIDSKKESITLLNQQSSGGADPSYICMDASKKFVLVANYKGSSVTVIAINHDGRLGEITANIKHTGRSIDTVRQTQPYVHSVRLDPTNRFALVADLGLDKLFVYRFNSKTGSLEPNDPPFVKVSPGSGPRHLAFHPNGKFVYLINEMASTVITFAWDSATGKLTELQTSSTLPADFKGKNACAEIEVYPNGKFLYASNRGHESLAVFAINNTTGKISLLECIPTLGHSPRNFAFDPTFKWLIVTNHGSDNAMVFKVDDKSGHLIPVGEPVPIVYPFGIRFLPVK
ncbi:MAG: lactonase family protein [Bacteroidia bacterium]|nr:lactonase family protein [Bacteroidia bacterium]